MPKTKSASAITRSAFLRCMSLSPSTNLDAVKSHRLIFSVVLSENHCNSILDSSDEAFVSFRECAFRGLAPTHLQSEPRKTRTQKNNRHEDCGLMSHSCLCQERCAMTIDFRRSNATIQ